MALVPSLSSLYFSCAVIPDWHMPQVKSLVKANSHNESSVEDWLRPAPNQFEGLYWRDEVGNSQHRYEPDFVVELKDEIIMIEVKPQEEIQDSDVQEKKKTADKYCELVSKSVGKYGIAKPWRYVIVPTEKITVSSTVVGLLNK